MRRTKLLLILFLPLCAWAFTPDTAAHSTFWLWTLIGRLHPMLVHFPIGLIIIVFLLECIAWRRRTLAYRAAVKPIMMVASISGVLSVVAGLLLANSESYGSELLPLHQWTGISTTVFCILSTWAYFIGRRRLGFLLLTVSVISLTVAGHYGASLTHGDDYLTGVIPSRETETTPDSDFDLARFASAQGPLDEASVQELNFQVRSILAHNCYSCHGAAKVKGKLRLDSKEAIMEGGENGAVINLQHPSASELLRRVKLPRSHKEAMPTKGRGLTAQEIRLLEYWIEKGAPWPEGPVKSLYRVAELAPRLPAMPSDENGRFTNPLDRFINAYFKQTKQDWPAKVDDRIFLKRVYLDVIGLLPTPDAIDAFMADTHPDKRNRLIQRLLADNHNYTQHWLTFWNDLLRNDYTGTGYITGGRHDITKWLYQSLYDNKPYNQFVKELISPDEQSKGFIAGIQWRGTVNSSQSTEMQAAQNVSQVFLGLNLKCASCHDSFISDWKLEDAYAFANLFADTILQIARCDAPTGKWADSRLLYPELGEIGKNLPKPQRLKQVAEKLVQPQDGRLYRTLVNRIWAQLFGRGLVEPVDEMDNEPWNQDLLDWLAWDFVESGYDIKKLLYTILSSDAYQLPSVTVKDPEQLKSKDYQFAGMVRRRLTAEQFADAIGVAYLPLYPDNRIVSHLPDSVKNKSLFTRASMVINDPFLLALGRPARETVTTSRSSQANLIQALELTNGSVFHEGIKNAAEHWHNQQPATEALVKDLYRRTLGRVPNKEELSIATRALGSQPGMADIQDFLWVMAMHPEFQLIY
jgi:uncharacterized membrane protein/mono/diheme cytochrome c family protein